MTDTPAGFATVALLLERLLSAVEGLRADLASMKAPLPPRAVVSPDLLDVSGAACHCACSLSTIYRAAERGDLACRRVGARLRFDRADLDAWTRGERARPGAVVALRARI